jgi:hypothetical protein
MFAAESLFAPEVVEAAPQEEPAAPALAEAMPPHDEPRATQPPVPPLLREEREETQPAVEPTQREQLVATQPALEPDLRAESLAAQAEPTRGAVLEHAHYAVTEAPPFAAAPNEQADFSRPIAVHVEPAAAALEETPPTPPPEPMAAPPAPAQAEPEVKPETAVAVEEPPPAFERRRFARTPPWERPAYRPREEAPSTGARPSEPLRVEVEIDAELEVAQGVEIPHPEIVIPDAVHRSEPSKPRAVVELVAQPARAWGDILIALWLVLVASAVIAALLWRR